MGEREREGESEGGQEMERRGRAWEGRRGREESEGLPPAAVFLAGVLPPM